MSRRMVGIRLSAEEEQTIREALPLWDAKRSKWGKGASVTRWNATLAEFIRQAATMRARWLLSRRPSNDCSMERQTKKASTDEVEP